MKRTRKLVTVAVLAVAVVMRDQLPVVSMRAENQPLPRQILFRAVGFTN